MSEIRSELIDKLADAWSAGTLLEDHPLWPEFATLSAAEHDVLQWRFEEREGALQEVLRLMAEQGAATIADIKWPDDPEVKR